MQWSQYAWVLTAPCCGHPPACWVAVYRNLGQDKELRDALGANPKVEVTDEGLYIYKPEVANVRNREQLLAYLRRREAAGEVREGVWDACCGRGGVGRRRPWPRRAGCGCAALFGPRCLHTASCAAGWCSVAEAGPHPPSFSHARGMPAGRT